MEKLRDDTGVPVAVATTRLIEWFASFDRMARLAIINGDPQTKRELALAVLNGMAAEPIQGSVADEDYGGASFTASVRPPANPDPSAPESSGGQRRRRHR